MKSNFFHMLKMYGDYRSNKILYFSDTHNLRYYNVSFPWSVNHNLKFSCNIVNTRAETSQFVGIWNVYQQQISTNVKSIANGLLAIAIKVKPTFICETAVSRITFILRSYDIY